MFHLTVVLLYMLLCILTLLSTIIYDILFEILYILAFSLTQLCAFHFTYIATFYLTFIVTSFVEQKTRCSPRTRMQSRKTLLWNKLVIYVKSLAFFPVLPYQCTVDCRMRNGVECKVKSVKKVECWVGNVMCRVWSGDFGVWSVKCKV